MDLGQVVDTSIFEPMALEIISQEYNSDKLSCLPLQFTITNVFYNKDAFEAAGLEVPTVDDRWTMDEVYEAAAKLMADGGVKYSGDLAKALATIRQVVDQLRREGPTSEELERAREQSKANVVMGLESTQSRMSHAGRSLLFSGEILTPEQIIAAYDSVTHEDVVALAQEIFRWDQVSLSAVGQVRTAEAYRALVLEA